MLGRGLITKPYINQSTIPINRTFCKQTLPTVTKPPKVQPTVKIQSLKPLCDNCPKGLCNDRKMFVTGFASNEFIEEYTKYQGGRVVTDEYSYEKYRDVRCDLLTRNPLRTLNGFLVVETTRVPTSLLVPIEMINESGINRFSQQYDGKRFLSARASEMFNKPKRAFDYVYYSRPIQITRKYTEPLRNVIHTQFDKLTNALSPRIEPHIENMKVIGGPYAEQAKEFAGGQFKKAVSSPSDLKKTVMIGGPLIFLLSKYWKIMTIGLGGMYILFVIL